MTPVPLSKLSADSGDSSPNTSNVILEDSSSQGTDYIEKQFGWPYVECVVNIYSLRFLKKVITN